MEYVVLCWILTNVGLILDWRLSKVEPILDWFLTGFGFEEKERDQRRRPLNHKEEFDLD